MLRTFLCTIRVADTIVEYRAIAAHTMGAACRDAAGAYTETTGVSDLTVTAKRMSDGISSEFLATPGTLIDPAVATMALMFQNATDKLRRAERGDGMEVIVTEVTVRGLDSDEGEDVALAALKLKGLNPEGFYLADAGDGYAVFRSRLDKVD